MLKRAFSQPHYYVTGSDLAIAINNLIAEVLRLKKIVEQAEELNSAPKTDLFALRDSEASKELPRRSRS